MPYTDNPVSRRLWLDLKFKALSTDAQRTFFYALTCEARSPEGFYGLRWAVAKEDLRLSDKALREALAALAAADLAHYDHEAEVLFVSKALKHVRRISGEPQVKGALRSLELVQDAPELFARFWIAAEKYQPELHAGLRNRYPKYQPQPTTTPHDPSYRTLSKDPLREGLEDPLNGSEEGQNPRARPEVVRLSQLLADLILERDPKSKANPLSREWLDAIRLLIDADKRTPAEVEHVLRWSQRDPFWSKNILSAPKLRKQFEALYAKAGRPPAELAAEFDKEMNIA